MCINGNVATNGTIAAASANFNVNGQRTEHVGAEMILINSRLSQTFFETASTTVVNGDYSVEDVNIYINDPLDVTGDIDLTGNIDLNAGIRSLEDITISGNVENSRNGVICSQTGDISIDTTNVNFSGLIYAPYGDITIDSDNLNLNSVIIIGQTVTITCPNLNMNYSPVMGQIVGSVSTDSGDTDPVADGRIIAMGDYDSEANAVDISWFTESDPSSFEILVSDDNTEYTSAAVVNEGTEYSYPIGEGFDTRYFKVSYTDSEGSVTESIPFYVERTEDGYDVKLLDSDGDELPDLYESIMGTDPMLADTDNDGLTDYQEICLTGTDPLKADSVTEGVSDADADIDEDGISNTEEIAIGTDPRSSDTDEDGLSDYDEINTHHTDPLNEDTDGDSIMDGSEWKIGLDPTNGSTHGVPDGEYSIEQTVGSDSLVFALINTEDSPYDLSVRINTTGCAEDEMTVTESGYSHAIENEMITGQSVDISMPEERTAETMRVSFSIRDDQVGNKLNKYTDCEELCGIKRFNVFHFYEGVNMLLPVETSFDTENNVVYTDTTESGTYCLVDMEYWMDSLGIEPAGAGEPSNGFMTMQGASIGADDTVIQKQRFDGRDYALIESGMITWSEAKAACENMGGHLCTITNESEQHFIEQLIDSGTKDSYWLGGTDEADEGNWSWITGEPWLYENWGNGQPSDQNSSNASTPADTLLEDYLGITRLYHSWGATNEWNDYKTDDPVIGGYICEWENEDIEGTKYEAFIATRWKTITLDTPLSPDSDTDTDRDTLTDWEEVKNEYLTLKDDGTYELSRFYDIVTAVDYYAFAKRFSQEDYYEKLSNIWNKRVLGVNSDPTKIDSDEDGLSDDLDKYPFSRQYDGFLIYETRDTDKTLMYYGNSADQPYQDFRYSDKSLSELCDLKNINLGTIAINTQIEMRSLIQMHSRLFADKEMDYVINDMFNNFFSGRGGTYSNGTLTERAREHQSSIKYIEQTTSIVNEWISNNNGTINGLRYTESERENSQMVLKMKDKVDPPTYDEKFTGLGMCVDGTFGNRIEITSYSFDGNTYSYKIRYTIYDVFGLDDGDIHNPDRLLDFGVLRLFKYWYILQHYDKYDGKYKPFITYICFEEEVEGTIENE